MAEILQPLEPAPLRRLNDGTIKQLNPLTGTEVWTVPGRANRPGLSLPQDVRPLEGADRKNFCAFCSQRYFDTPPEKSRLVRRGEGWHRLDGLHADRLYEEVAEFRRIPNLFEIVSYDYWHLNHNHYPSEAANRRMAEYLGSQSGYDHVLRVVRARLEASGAGQVDLPDDQLVTMANGFFAGGHDVIVARRHFTDDAVDTAGLASSGTLTPDEHREYIKFTIRAMRDLYGLNPAVKYVAAFQNWLKPAGASFDHLHKQLVALDETSVQLSEEIERIRKNPLIYAQIMAYALRRNLQIAANEHAVAFADFGHRFPTIAVWALGPVKQPWEYMPEEIEGISDVLHAVHAATGPAVACNEEWYHRPAEVTQQARFRILVKWRLTTLAGFEGGTRIYLNTIDPWTMRDRLVATMEELRAQGKIAPLTLGTDIKLDPLADFGYGD